MCRSLLRSALDPAAPNLRADFLAGETTSPSPAVQTRWDDSFGDTMVDGIDAPSLMEQPNIIPPDDEDGESKNTRMPIVNPEQLIGRTFLKDLPDGQRHRSRIVELVEDHLSDVGETNLKFRCSMNDDQYEELLGYHEVMDHISKQEDGEIMWKFKKIAGHEGPLSLTHPSYNGCNYNVIIEWENGEITHEPLSSIAADDPVTCAIYASENNLLDKPGWKRFKSIAKRQKKLFRMANQAKLRSFRMAPKYKYGFEIPRDYKHAMELDKKNGTHEKHGNGKSYDQERTTLFLRFLLAAEL